MKTRHQAKPSRRQRRRPKALTSDVVIAPQIDQTVPRKWRSHFSHLVSLREHLLRERGTLNQGAKDFAPNYSQHMADAASDNYDRDFALSMLSSEQNAIYE